MSAGITDGFEKLLSKVRESGEQRKSRMIKRGGGPSNWIERQVYGWKAERSISLTVAGRITVSREVHANAFLRMHCNCDPGANVIWRRDPHIEKASSPMTSSDAGKVTVRSSSQQRKAFAPIRTSPSQKLKLTNESMSKNA
jgi:hypothetical protein